MKIDHYAIAQADELLKNIEGVISQVMSKAQITVKDIRSIGVGLPGQVDYVEQTLRFAPGLSLRNIAVSTKMRDVFQLPVFIDNDVNCATLAELSYGKGKNYDNFVCIFIGTGIGAGIVVNKKLVRGKNYAAGEIGHMKIDCSKEARPCTCGGKGCFEEYASARAIIRLAREQIFLADDRKISTPLRELDARRVRPEDIVRVILSDPDDKICKQLIKQIADYLAIGIANIVNLLNPESVILGGGIIKGFYEEILSFRNEFHQNFESAVLDVCKNVKISNAEFIDKAPIIGAALLGHESEQKEF